ncbi:MAG: hypothetical protein AAFQ79_15670 [Pseudomonadota bacterium]
MKHHDEPKPFLSVPYVTGAATAVGTGAAVLSLAGPAWLALGVAAGSGLAGFFMTNQMPGNED